MKANWLTWYYLLLAAINLPFVRTGHFVNAISMGFILGLMFADLIDSRGERA